MEKKTYYMVLGITRTETPTGIRAAYRDRARRLHPDVAGEAATRAFQELTEAYEVLSDPARRHAYNAQLAMAPRLRAPISILGDAETIHPSFEEVHARFARNFTGLHVPKAERPVALEVEVLLSRDEAAAGCDVPVGGPVFAPCPRCRGARWEWSYPCAACRQSGMIESERLVHVRVPPLAPPGAIYELALGGLGIHNFHLRLHVSVET